MKALLPHQVLGAQFLREHRYAMLCDSPGLGKTLQALAAIVEYPCIIVSPAGLIDNWWAEIREWEDFLNLRSDQITIISYAKLGGMLKKIDRFYYKTMILDESHMVKNYSSARSRDTINFIKRKKPSYVYLLTATPFISSVEDYWNQLRAVGLTMKLSDYRRTFMESERYYEYMAGRYIIKYFGLKNKERLVNLLQKKILKRDKYSELGMLRKKRIISHVTLTNEEKLQGLESFEDVNIDDKSEHLMKIRQAVGLCKLKACVRYIKDLLKEDPSPIVVFAWHLNVLQELSKHLPYSPIIKGGVKTSKRTEIIKDFQNGEHELVLCNIQTAGVGLTLTRAHRAVFCELDWSPSNLIQAEDRIHRIGQAKQVEIHYLLMNHFFEQRVWRLLQEKMDLIESTIGLVR